MTTKKNQPKKRSLKSIGLFFLKKLRPKTQAERAEEMMQLAIKYLPLLKQAANRNDAIVSDGEIIGRLYDFVKNADDFQAPFEFEPGHNHETGERLPDNRPEAKPKEILDELETVPTPFTVENLDQKIESLKSRESIMTNRFSKNQIKGLIQCLENRFHYANHAEFFSQFPNTTDEKIYALVKKYKLKVATSDLFIPTFPDEAIKTMKAYTDITKKITGSVPVYYVIAEESDFKKKYEKLDPILLVQSPFGFYWQILGAWDKEMLLLSEL